MIPWRTRLLILYAAVRMLVTGRHVYVSTGCIAGEHDYCASMVGAQGEKRGGRSKFSDAPCICWCRHPVGGVPTRVGTPGPAFQH